MSRGRKKEECIKAAEGKKSRQSGDTLAAFAVVVVSLSHLQLFLVLA
jgi:hypothetical protein